jgi:hypothetical protein
MWVVSAAAGIPVLETMPVDVPSQIEPLLPPIASNCFFSLESKTEELMMAIQRGMVSIPHALLEVIVCSFAPLFFHPGSTK